MFRETPITRAIALIGIPSARCSRRISAQSSTVNTRFLPGSTRARVSGGGQISAAARGQFSRAVDRLVDAEKVGRQRIYRVLPSGLQKLQAEIDRFWTDELDLLVADAHRTEEQTT